MKKEITRLDIVLGIISFVGYAVLLWYLANCFWNFLVALQGMSMSYYQAIRSF